MMGGRASYTQAFGSLWQSTARLRSSYLYCRRRGSSSDRSPCARAPVGPCRQARPRPSVTLHVPESILPFPAPLLQRQADVQERVAAIYRRVVGDLTVEVVVDSQVRLASAEGSERRGVRASVGTHIPRPTHSGPALPPPTPLHADLLAVRCRPARIPRLLLR